MRIHEIISEDLVDPEERVLPQSTAFNVKKMAKRAGDVFHGVSPNRTGGLYAQGTPDPKDPFMYRKKLRQPSRLEKDAYYQYIDFIKPYMSSNPFFPRVYSVDVKIDRNGLEKPSYKMEKLTSISDADDRMGGKLDDVMQSNYLEKPVDDFWEYIYEIVESGDVSNVSDTRLKGAILLIRKFLSKHPNFSADIHIGNMMIRFTPNGPQLVFTDPVQDNGESIVGYSPAGWNLPTGVSRPETDYPSTDYMSRKTTRQSAGSTPSWLTLGTTPVPNKNPGK